MFLAFSFEVVKAQNPGKDLLVSMRWVRVNATVGFVLNNKLNFRDNFYLSVNSVIITNVSQPIVLNKKQKRGHYIGFLEQNITTAYLQYIKHFYHKEDDLLCKYCWTKIDSNLYDTYYHNIYTFKYKKTLKN